MHRFTVNSKLPMQKWSTSFNQILSYATLVRRLKHSGVFLADDTHRLNSLRQCSRGKTMFPNLCYLQLGQWPLTVVEASLLFGAKLCIIKLTRISMSPSPKYHRHKHWGRLTRNLQQQLCIQMLRRRAKALSTFRTHISIGIPYGYSHKRWTMSEKRSRADGRSTFQNQIIHLVGSTDIHIEYLGYLARIGDLSCLQYDTANSYITGICEVELCIIAHDTQ